MFLNGSDKLFASKWTLKIQPYLPAQVLHVQNLFWDSQEGDQVRTCLQNTYSGKLCPLDLFFHSNVIEEKNKWKHENILLNAFYATKLFVVMSDD